MDREELVATITDILADACYTHEQAGDSAEDIVKKLEEIGIDKLRPALSNDILAALKDVVGLVQLVLPTLTGEQHEAVRNSHRLTAGIAAIERAESGR